MVTRTLFSLAPAIAHFAPSRATLSRLRSQMHDVFHVPEMPWQSLFNASAALCFLGVVEVFYVKPIRDQQERSARLQEFITRSRLEGFDKACGIPSSANRALAAA